MTSKGTFGLSSLVPSRVQIDESPETSSTPNTFDESSNPNVADFLPRQTRNRRHRQPAQNDDSDSSETVKRRKLIGGLRLAPASQQVSPQMSEEPEPSSGRQLQAKPRQFPQRKAIQRDEHALKPSTLNKLILGIWEQIFSSINFNMSAVIDEWHEAQADQGLIMEGSSSANSPSGGGLIITRPPNRAFSQMSILCRKISQASRVSRALEVVVQARWVEHFDDRVQAILDERGHVSQTKAKMAALAEACRDFSWTEKELRNKMCDALSKIVFDPTDAV